MTNFGEAEFGPALADFFEGVKRISNEYHAKNYPSLTPDGWRLEWLKRYVRISRVTSGAHCFVDRLTGDVLKPASWKAPAKHARGNIFDADKGLKSMGPYGPAYLR